MKVRKLRPETVLDWARVYISKGWRVIPLLPLREEGKCGCGNPNCDRAGKHPATPGGATDGTTDAERIEEWFGGKSRYGIAIVTGKVSGVSGLDVDMKDGKAGDLALNALRDGEAMPDAPTVRTPTGGLHYYFKYNPSIRTAKEPFGAGTAIDTRNENGYLVAPPSPHYAGGTYSWLDFKSDPPEWPEWLRAKQQQQKKKAKSKETFDPRNPRAVEQLRHALTFVDPLDYDRWVGAGLALGRAFARSEAGFTIYNEWSARAGAKYDHRKTHSLYHKDSRREGDMTVASIFAWAQENEAYEPLEFEAERAHRVIDDGVDLAAVFESLDAAAAAANVYARGTELVALGEGGLVRYTPKVLAMELSKHVSYLAERRGGALSSVAVPEARCAMLIEAGRWNAIRRLKGFAPFPIFRKDWTLVEEDGWDAMSEMVVTVPKGINVCPDIDALLDLVVDFPWVHERDRSIWLAALFTVGLRYMFPTAPMFGFSSFAPGSGKGLLVDVIATLWYGRAAKKVGWPEKEAEMLKLLGAEFRSGTPILTFDNIDRGEKVHDAALCTALTTETMGFRLLGKTESVELPTAATFFATGNDLTFTGDTERRTLTAIIDPQEVDPSRRRSFKHPRLLAYVRRERGRLLGAALGCVARWVEAGRPTTGYERGGFEDWSATIDGILSANGLPSLGDGSDGDESRRGADESGVAEAAWLALITRLLYTDASARYTTIELTHKIQNNSELRSAFISLYPQICYHEGRKDRLVPTAFEISITLVGRLFREINGRWRGFPNPPHADGAEGLGVKRRVVLVTNLRTKQRNWQLEEAPL